MTPRTTPTDLQLRAIEPEDLDTLYAIENDTTLWSVGATNVPYSRYALHDYIAHASSDIYADRQVRLVIERSDNTVVGIVDLVNFDPSHRRAEVGIVIVRTQRRQGYARQALTLIHDYALRVVHLHQLYAVVDENNNAAARLFLSMGYRHNATLRQWLYNGEQYHNALLMQKILEQENNNKRE